MNLTCDELKMISGVLNVSLRAVDSSKLILSTTLTIKELETVDTYIDSLLEIHKGDDLIQVTLEDKAFNNLKVTFRASISIALDFDEIHTLTGFEEEEFRRLEKKLLTC